MDDGIIELDSERGLLLGFTSDRFHPGSYLWANNGAVIVSFIVSLKRGNFRDLVNSILSRGMRVEIPTPLDRMREIVVKCGYTQTSRYVEELEDNVEVWVLSP